MAAPALNRRANYRLQRRFDHPWQINVDDSLITKNIVDLSASGISFKAPSSFNMEPGQILNLTVTLTPDEQFECQGRILWARSETSSSRTMKLFGVKFENLPLSIDTQIAQELHKDALKAHWANPDQGSLTRKSSPHPALYEPSQLPSLIKQFITLGLIVAFFVAVHLYQKTHPEDSIEYRFNQSLAKKIGHF